MKYNKSLFVAMLLLGAVSASAQENKDCKTKVLEAASPRDYQGTSKSVVTAYYKIQDGVVNGYKKIQDGVVNGYKKIQDGVVRGWEIVEDGCVRVLFKKDNETVEEAKERLNNHE